ncbi:type IV secretion system protein [Dyella sp. A6]|uniref:type IV secretion system protein n=1 Tax=Dyella aluminiiresistens TaxID=3069105 RepID=UPI002E7A7E23|nr:type IV secretion system protein [Dyella sp. A6]
MTNFVFFTLIYAWLSHKIDAFGDALMGRMMLWVAGIATVLVTFWIMITGYRVMTGQLREPLMAVVTHMARVVIILSAATTMSVFGANLNTFLTTDLGNEINQAVSGNSDSLYATIDKNLAYTEIAMSAIDAIQLVPGNTDLANQKEHASFWAGFGTAGPPMTAAVMLLMYRFAMALFIGFGPLFILCLMFEQTKSLFNRWLMYGIGTLFSLAVLNVIAAMVMQLSIGIAAGMWSVTLIEHFTGGSTEGLSHQALEQGGIGLLLTMLIITVPPMAANFFQGTLGNFLHYSAFGGFGRPGPQGQPPGMYSFYSEQQSKNPNASEGKTPHMYHPSRVPSTTPSNADAIKPRPVTP